jgi:hypothetical protein
VPPGWRPPRCGAEPWQPHDGGQRGPVDADGFVGGDGDPTVPVQQAVGVDHCDADELVDYVVAEDVPFGRLVEVDGRARVDSRARVADVQVENVVRDVVRDGSSRR